MKDREESSPPSRFYSIFHHCWYLMCLSKIYVKLNLYVVTNMILYIDFDVAFHMSLYVQIDWVVVHVWGCGIMNIILYSWWICDKSMLICQICMVMDVLDVIWVGVVTHVQNWSCDSSRLKKLSIWVKIPWKINKKILQASLIQINITTWFESYTKI